MSGLAAALADRYRIERELGAGGMATVYLAQDLKHDRQVAVKVLRAELAAILGGERFLHEIRVTAKLNHPHILPLLDSGTAGGDAEGIRSFLYYVTSYIEGGNLRERMSKAGALPLDEAIRITRGVAAALEYAHHHGVIHRDIKPENILLQEGEPVVADFGIALAVSTIGKERLTETGLSLGTPAYMSPEQASAESKIDGRSDEYSLACVLYEMLAGEPPYTGPSAQAIIAKRFSEPVPRLSTLREVPDGIERSITQALARNPADRFGSVAEFVQALDAARITASIGSATREVVVPRRTGISPRWVALLTATVVIAGLAVMGLYLRSKPAGNAPAPAMHQVTFTGTVGDVAVSPDGKWLAYVSGDSLMVQDLAGNRAIPVFTGVWLRTPRWSPDGGSLCVGAQRNADVATDAVYEVPRFGGEVKRIGGNPMSCDYSPDGKLIAWTESGSDSNIVILDRASGQVVRRLYAPGTWNIRWSPDGRWIAAQSAFLDLISVDGRITQRIVDSAAGVGRMPFAWAGDGAGLYQLRFEESASHLVRIAVNRRSGKPEGAPARLVGGLTAANNLAVSGDGRVLALSIGPTRYQVMAISLTGSSEHPTPVIRQVTSGTKVHHYAAVSPDGRWLAWVESDPSSENLVVAPFEGGETRILRSYQGGSITDPLWAPDSRRLGYVLTDSSGGRIMITSLEGEIATEVVDVQTGLVRYWTWAGGRVLGWSPRQGGFLLTDPDTRQVQRLDSPDSLGPLYDPVVSPDGRELIGSRSTPFGVYNDMWLGRLAGGGSWTRLPFDHPGNAQVSVWDESGLYVGGQDQAGVVYRARVPGGSSDIYLTARQCGNWHISFSRDRRRATCREREVSSDVWIVTGFDPEIRGAEVP